MPQRGHLGTVQRDVSLSGSTPVATEDALGDVPDLDKCSEDES